MNWTKKHPRASIEMLGFIPAMLAAQPEFYTYAAPQPKTPAHAE